tara:strand:- start:114 stop:341 length:228 start_codon:yes stop_codon:yes gene_type:complete
MIDQNPSPPLPSNYLLFDAALRHETYGFYLGTARPVFKDNFSTDKREAFTYSRAGACAKKSRFPTMFMKCEVVAC